jgi:hypothetical protein
MCTSNNAAKTGHAVAVSWHNWTFAGSDDAGRRGDGDLQRDRNRQAQRYRAAGLAQRRNRPPAHKRINELPP